MLAKSRLDHAHVRASSQPETERGIRIEKGIAVFAR